MAYDRFKKTNDLKYKRQFREYAREFKHIERLNKKRVAIWTKLLGLDSDKKDWFNPNATGICLGIRINLEKIKFFFISCSKLTYSNL